MTDKTAAIGSIVFFKQPKLEPVLAAGRVHPALVTGAKPDGSLSLRVFIDGVESVRLIPSAQPYDEAMDSGWSAEIPEVLRQDGPTLTEYMDHGYKATGYPPTGYAAKPMTAEEQAIYDAARLPDEELPPPPESPFSKASQEIVADPVVVTPTPQPEVVEPVAAA